MNANDLATESIQTRHQADTHLQGVEPVWSDLQ